MDRRQPGDPETGQADVSRPAGRGEGTHERQGVVLLPRPSLIFTTGEIITVYLEIYGLRRDNFGRRQFTGRVTVTSTGGDEGVLEEVKNLFTGGQERTTSQTLSFEREPEQGAETVAEHFTVDTSLLLPGEYRMGIEVANANGRELRKAGCTFNLEEPD